jgi:hypothetical protein
MSRVVTVRPDQSGWAVELESHTERRLFPSGAAAEAAAKAIAAELTARGEPAEIRIHLRDGRLGARFLCPEQALEWA